MKDRAVKEFRKKTQSQLLREIDKCKSISQLFAFIQHENISLQMHSQSSASNITVRKLGSKEVIDKNDTPFERLKKQVRKAVENNSYNS